MADLTYNVVVEYGSRGRIDGGIDSAKGSTDKWMKGMFDGVGKLTGAFDSAFDSAASAAISTFAAASTAIGGILAAAVGKGIHEGFKFNENSEMATLGMGTIFASNGTGSHDGIDPLVDGLRVAETTIAQMKKDARELPGEFKDLQAIMTAISGPGARAGLDAFGTEQLAAKTMVGAEIFQIPQNVAAREMKMLLDGTARHGMPLVSALNIETKGWKDMSQYDRFKKLNEELTKANKATYLLKNTWQGELSTAVDSVRQSLGAIANPLFQRVKERLHGFNTRTGPDGKPVHQSTVDAFIDFGVKAGDVLVKAFDQAEAKILHWYPIFATFGQTMYHGLSHALAGVAPLIEKVFGRIESFMKDPQAFDKLAHVATMMVGARAGSAALGAGSSMIGPAIQAAGAMGVEMAALGPVAAVAALALAELGVGVYGAVHSITDTSSEFHDTNLNLLNEIRYNTTQLSKSLAKLGDAVTPIADMFGTALLYGINSVIIEIQSWVDMIKMAGSALSWFRDQLPHFASEDKSLNDPDEAANVAAAASQLALNRTNEFSSGMRMVKAMDTDNAESGRSKALKPPTHHTTVHKIEIKVEGNEDPDRVAQTVFKKLDEKFKNPTSGNFAVGQQLRSGRGSF